MKRIVFLWLCLMTAWPAFANNNMDGLAPLADPYILFEDGVYYA